MLEKFYITPSFDTLKGPKSEITVMPRCGENDSLLEFMKEFSDACNYEKRIFPLTDKLIYSEEDALELLHKLPPKYNSLKNSFGNRCNEFSFKVCKTRDDAVMPSKVNASDTGYDLTILEPVKQYGNLTLYETGIKVMPSFGWYFDVVPRSSIVKTGYMMGNSVGVIDSQYRDTIKVALMKVDPNAEDLKLPMRIAQLIPRRRVHAEPEVVEESEFNITNRNLGGFGSTGV